MRLVLGSLFLLGVAFPSCVLGGVPSVTPWPWEIWANPHLLPQVPEGGQVLLRSSHCPWGCPLDRHSEGDSRFLRMEGSEGVVFEEVGPGAITRIWMTTGDGTSAPLDPSIRIRFYFDGEDDPRIDLPLPSLFDGSTPPFLPPLVGDRVLSSGGNFNVVPIPFGQSCRVTLEGAEATRLWFQFTFHRLPYGNAVPTWTGQEDLSGWASFLNTAGSNPWLGTPSRATTDGTVEIPAGGRQVVLSEAGSALVTGLKFRVPESLWPQLNLEIETDGFVRVDVPFNWFFAQGRSSGLAARSVLLGLDDDGYLYSYFPQPYFESIRIAIENHGNQSVSVDYWTRVAVESPAPGSGLFGAILRVADPSTQGEDIPILDIRGAGRWVGLFGEFSSVDTLQRNYLEGDERVFIDGSRHPSLYGTGVEDFFGGGFYFDKGPFRLPLHGMSYQAITEGSHHTSAYRLLLTDAPSFGSQIRVGLEAGPDGDLPMRSRSVAYYYQRLSPALRLQDRLDLGNPASRVEHEVAVTGVSWMDNLEAEFEGEPPVALTSEGLYRNEGVLSFRLDRRGCLGSPRLRRLLDAGYGGQHALISVASPQVRDSSMTVGLFSPIETNTSRRWREVDSVLALDPGVESLHLSTRLVSQESPLRNQIATMTDFVYELWCSVDVLIFTDGFESGDFSSWSSVQGLDSRKAKSMVETTFRFSRIK